MMAHRENNGIGRFEGMKLRQRDAVFMPCIGGVCEWVMDLHHQTERLKLVDNVDDAGIARVRDVLLEGQSKHGNDPALRLPPQKAANAFARDTLAHAVVDAATGKDDVA